MEETLFVHERRTDRSTVAELLRTVADTLDDGEPVTLSAGEESISLDVPARPEFEIKVERETDGAESELSVEFELEWDEEQKDASRDLSIE